MKKTTLFSALLFLAMTANVYADDIMVNFQEKPVLKKTASAGASGFTATNPDKTGLNKTDSCGVYFRVKTGNYYAAFGTTFSYPADLVNFGQRDPIFVPEDMTKYVHVLINTNTEIRPLLQLTGFPDVPAINLEALVGTLKVLNVWTDLVYEIKGKVGGSTIVGVDLRADYFKVCIPDAIQPNISVLPSNTVLAAGTGIVYFDEIIVNDDPTPRSVNSGVKDLNDANKAKVYTNGRKINVDLEGNASATLFNHMGQQLNTKVFNNNCEFDVKNAGVYLVQVNGKTSRVIVN